MAIYLLDNTLKVEIFYDEIDHEFSDNICLSLTEECPADEKVLSVDQVNLYLTIEQALALARALHAAANDSGADSDEPSSPGYD